MVNWVRDAWVDRTSSADKGGVINVCSEREVTTGLVAHGRASVDRLKMLHAQGREEREARLVRSYTCCDIRSMVYNNDVCSVFTRLHPVTATGCVTAGAAFAQMGFHLFADLPPRGTPEREEFTLELAERAAEQVRLHLQEFLIESVHVHEWIGTAWRLKLHPYPTTDPRPDVVFKNVTQMDRFFSAYSHRDEEGMPSIE